MADGPPAAKDTTFDTRLPPVLPTDADPATDPSDANDASPKPDADPAAADVPGAIDLAGPPDAASDGPPVIDSPAPGQPLGADCNGGLPCAQGTCVDGVCCASACTEACHACNLPGSPGTCAPEPANTICAPSTCGSGQAQLESRCNAGGQCVAGAVTGCGPYACYMTFCGSACISASDCVAPYTCSGISCVSPGLLLYWPMDEDSGTTVQDASGNGRTGVAIGNGSTRAQPSTNVAPVKFPNPRSRDFSAVDDQGIVASPIPAPIKTNPELTLAGWFRATAVEADGSDVVDLGSDYFLRVRSDKIEMVKRKGTQSGSVYAFASSTAVAAIDGLWHHLAGTSGATGMKVYFDGIGVGSSSNTEPPIFSGYDQIGAGHQPGNDVHEFNGQIDDVRIYNRVLSADEIANLAHGNR